MNRTFAPMMLNQPVSQPKTIEHLLETLGERVQLRPWYQRDITWSLENMCDLISSVMHCGFIMGFLLYKLQPGDEGLAEGFRTECVDGQHRLYTFFHFFNSKAFLLGKKKVLISLPYTGADGRTVNVFYKKTADTDEWAAENRDKQVDYFTPQEQDHFNNFLLDVREIRSALSSDQRCKLFLSLQKGKPVRGSDYYKNKTAVPLVKFIAEEMRWEKQVKNSLESHCTVAAKSYWLHWIVRLYLLQQASDDDEKVVAFMRKDAQITDMMKNGSPLLNSTAETEAAFKKSVTRFLSFLENLPAGVKLTPTQFHVVFVHLLNAEEGREIIITSHMKEWSMYGMNAKERKMWENRGFEDAERQDGFERSLDEITRWTTVAPEIGARKTIPKKIRKKVWSNAFGLATTGHCVCCKEEIDMAHWEQAHVIAHACGGKDTADNLRPTCRGCNREMGTENLWAYKARCYPDK